jgi:hypothetical protein
MVGILADNDDFHFVKRAQIEGVEYKSARWVNSGSLVFASYKLSESDKVIFFKFGCQMLFPAFFYLYVHGISFIIKCALKIGVICKNDK